LGGTVERNGGGPVQTQPTHSCPACRIIDRADGVEDGKLYRTVVGRIGDERRILRRLRDTQDRFADDITNFSGSMRFVYIHSVWFALWIMANVGAFGAALVFDRFPFGLLTLVVSLEAIFLSTFILISQNRQSERSEIRSQIDFENNLRSEMWAVHIGQAIGIDPEHVEEVIRRSVEGYASEGPLSRLQ
jgi:uncharacterized protein DUF1003